MADLLPKEFRKQRALILGFGREGQSTYQYIRNYYPEKELFIADQDPSIGNNPLILHDRNAVLQLGKNYMRGLSRFDMVFKTPGITLKTMEGQFDPVKVTSQTDLFLNRYSDQVIGVTGTKGKSTTSTLIHHILRESGHDAVLLGNIGVPAFSFEDKIKHGTIIVYELSSHQLEFIHRGPHIGILLNLFEEHLDDYLSFAEYQLAKFNIALMQKVSDSFIFNSDDKRINKYLKKDGIGSHLVPFARGKTLTAGCYTSRGRVFWSDGKNKEVILETRDITSLTGDHNLYNIMAAVAACRLSGVESASIREGISTFKSLEHRLEYAGEVNGIQFYNDSISTIPEASIAAVATIKNTATILLGGYDRGIDYSKLARFLADSGILNFILTGPAGDRIAKELMKLDITGKNLFRINRFEQFMPLALNFTPPGKACLLSPAASSYDEFRNFEERGRKFKELVMNSIAQTRTKESK